MWKKLFGNSCSFANAEEQAPVTRSQAILAKPTVAPSTISNGTSSTINIAVDLSLSFKERFFLPWEEKPYTRPHVEVPAPAKNLIKEWDRFVEIKPEGVRLEKRKIAGKNSKKMLEKKVSQKRPADKKTSTKWIAKFQQDEFTKSETETQMEMLSGEIFRIMLGKD